MYSVSIRNIPNNAVPRMSPAMFAPTSVRSRKIENGISGSLARASQARKPPMSAAAAAKSPIVVGEVQPKLFACVMA